ncbi:unnamed protein product [Effrenium voratum]|nr:unnamed protein product [Effrenium voratum]
MGDGSEWIDAIFQFFQEGNQLSAKRLGDAMRKAGMNPTEPEVAEVAGRFGNPPSLDLTAFRQAMQEAAAQWSGRDQAQELLSSFQVFDPSKSGRLPVPKIVEIMRMGGNLFREDQLQAMLYGITVDGCWAGKGMEKEVWVATAFRKREPQNGARPDSAQDPIPRPIHGMKFSAPLLWALCVVGILAEERCHKGLALVQRQHEVVKSSPPVEAPFILYSLGAGRRHQRQALACLETWAAELAEDEQLQVVGLPAPDSNLSEVAWLESDCPDNHRPGGACKDAAGLRRAHELGADWAVLLGADNYVLTQHLRQALQDLEPSRPVIFAVTGCGHEKCSGGLCGGGGQIFSRGALMQIFQKSFQQDFEAALHLSSGWGDVANCRLARKHKVPVRQLDGLHAWQTGTSIRSWDLTYHYVGFEQMHHLHQLAQKPPHVSALEIRAEKEALICVGTRGFITLEPPLGKPSTSIAKAQPRRPHFPIFNRCLSPPPRFCTLCGCLLD